MTPTLTLANVQHASTVKLDNNHYTMLLHIEALTTAIEDAISALDTAPVDMAHVKAALTAALDRVWEAEEVSNGK